MGREWNVREEEMNAYLNIIVLTWTNIAGTVTDLPNEFFSVAVSAPICANRRKSCTVRENTGAARLCLPIVCRWRTTIRTNQSHRIRSRGFLDSRLIRANQTTSRFTFDYFEIRLHLFLGAFLFLPPECPGMQERVKKSHCFLSLRAMRFASSVYFHEMPARFQPCFHASRP